jgi:isoaspartyl peptidase/L-asparaginase-like protein (Ntn-hydrolase superfamily)
MNRHQRRALAKKMPGGLKPIADAATKLQEALGAVQKIERPEELARLVHEAYATVSLLVDDVQKIADDHELLRNLLFERDPALKLAFERAQEASVSMRTMAPLNPPCPECVKDPCPHL